MKKLLMLLLSVVIAFSAVACGGEEEMREDTSYFFIITTDSGYGADAVEDIASRFDEKYKDYSFAPGKKGVVVDVEAKGSNLYTTAIAQEAYHCYINPKSVDTSMIGSGGFLNIDEYMKTEIPGEGKTIDDKIKEGAKEGLQGESSKWGKGYYYTPGLAFMGGMTYDKNCFDEFGFYFLAPDQEEYNWFHSELMDQDVYFADPESSLFEEATAGKGFDNWDGWNSNQYLSCGPDGVYGTLDDGMASSLDELVMLCEYMKSFSIAPFVLSGKYPANHFYSSDGLMNSLLGPENMYTMKTFESEGLEIVTGYDTSKVLWKLDGKTPTYAPTTAVVPVTETSGYYATWSAARYYSTAFWKLAYEQNWYTDAVKRDTSHIEAQAEFIFSGYDSSRPRSAIMLEASYWINESQERNNFTDFTKMNYGKTGKEREKEIKWMSLPRELHGTVTEGNGTPETFMFLGAGTLSLFNANYAGDPEAEEMVKQWLLFYFSDENINFLTAVSGCPLPKIDYELTPESSLYDDEPFYRDLYSRLNNGIVVSPLDAKSGSLFTQFPELFAEHGWSSCWVGLDSENKTQLYNAFATKKYSVQHCFENAEMFFDEAEWKNILEAGQNIQSTVPTWVEDENGNKIVYKNK